MRKSTACVAVTVMVLSAAGCGKDDRAQPPGSTMPSPTWSPVKGRPETVPSVRSFHAASGPGWRPGTGTRVVVPSGRNGPLGDEARMLASDLGGKPVVWGDGGNPQAGDVRLELSGGASPSPLRTHPPTTRTADEAYSLKVSDATLTITAANSTGVFNGTRTVVQAVRTAGGVPQGTVHDRPDRARRGLILDIARKPYSESWIADRIREMGDLKLNELQLHFSDDQGWRIQSDTHPEIVSSQHLTKDQVRHLISLASERHITIIPEVDSPGHLGAVIAKHPDLQLKSSSGGKPEGTIDITNPQSAKIVDDLLREYAKLFPGPGFHLGGDEFLPLHNSDPDTTYANLKQHAVRSYGSKGTIEDLVTSWLNDRDRTVRQAGKTDVEAWNDGFFRDGQVKADKDRRVVYWTGREPGERNPKEYLKEGREVVNANDAYLYYVLGQPNHFTYPTGQGIYEHWNPSIIEHRDAVPASLAGPDKVTGARFGVWGDRPDAQTPAQVARGIRFPLAALAQRTWHTAQPPLSWDDFKKVVDKAAPEGS